MTKQIAVRVPVETLARLNALAKHTHRTATFYIREAIMEHIEDLEDLYLAEKELLEVRAGRSKIYTTEEMSKRLGLDS